MRSGMPSSVNPQAPASFSASISVSLPLLQTAETLAAWRIRIFSDAARSRMSDRTSVLSTTGEVLAMQMTVVKPPFAAASAGMQCFFIGESGIPEMDMGVDQPGSDDEPFGVDDFLIVWKRQCCLRSSRSRCL